MRDFSESLSILEYSFGICLNQERVFGYTFFVMETTKYASQICKLSSHEKRNSTTI